MASIKALTKKLDWYTRSLDATFQRADALLNDDNATANAVAISLGELQQRLDGYTQTHEKLLPLLEDDDAAHDEAIDVFM